MSLTTDNVAPSPVPNVWRIGNLTVAGVGIGVCLLAFCSIILAFGTFRLHLPPGALRTLAFVSVAFGSQATIYAIRERRHLWSSSPSLWLILSWAGDLLVSTLLATVGILMTALSGVVVGGTFAAAILFWIVLSLIRYSALRQA